MYQSFFKFIIKKISPCKSGGLKAFTPAAERRRTENNY